ncbi:MAG: hypothetical protein ACSHYA_01255 [Opitutaceae bacterium]
MAKAHKPLIEKLRETASNLESGANYSWGHVARCNCGHLAQSILSITPSEIYCAAQNGGLDEWSEYANEYCPASGAPIDDIIDALLQIGLELKDIHHLEYLSNTEVLHALPGGFRYLQKGNRHDSALYMRTWASLLEIKLKQNTVHSGLQVVSVR